jgi:acyl carrier protein
MGINSHRVGWHDSLQHEVRRDSSICALIADQLGLDAAHVTQQSHLLEDLGLDWMQRLDLVIRVEEKTGVELLDDDVDQIEFVGDLIRQVMMAQADQGERVRGGARH